MANTKTTTKKFNHTKKEYEQSDKPRSGCKMRENFETKSGVFKELVVSGWKYTKQHGYVTFAASLSKRQTKNPEFTTMVAKIVSGVGTSTVWAQWNEAKKTLWFPDQNMVADPVKGYWAYITPKTKR